MLIFHEKRSEGLASCSKVRRRFRLIVSSTKLHNSYQKLIQGQMMAPRLYTNQVGNFYNKNSLNDEYMHHPSGRKSISGEDLV